MKIYLILKPCPWCHLTPDLNLPIHDETWCWDVRCINDKCKVKPVCEYVSIRNRSKKEFYLFYEKIVTLAARWNFGNPLKAFERKKIDLTTLPDLNASCENACKFLPIYHFTTLDCGILR